MNTKIPILAILAIVIVIGSFFFLQHVAENSIPTATPNVDTTDNHVTPKTYSLVDISSHNSADDCWFAISNKVYDVTEFISSHPGGQAILEGCGTDATTLYETRPMGSGAPHSSGARELLANYYIGDLA